MTDAELDVLDLERETHDRAVQHRRQAVEVAQSLDPFGAAVVHALLAIEARLDELTWHVAGAR